MLKSYLYLEGIGSFYAVNRLNREGIPVYTVKKCEKSGILILIARKDVKKVFAILQSSCYNVKKVSPAGLARIARVCKLRAGLLLGACVFLAAVPLVQERVLRIDVVGSGAYYGEEVRALLESNGISLYGKFPRSSSLAQAEILSLADVTFCAISHVGGIVTVEVETGKNENTLPKQPLVAPVAGRVGRLTVMRGKALVEEGQSVEAGQILVDCKAEGREFVVVAQAEILTDVVCEYAAKTQEEALLKARFEHGEWIAVEARLTQNGWHVEGTVRTVARMNMK